MRIEHYNRIVTLQINGEKLKCPACRSSWLWDEFWDNSKIKKTLECPFGCQMVGIYVVGKKEKKVKGGVR